MNEKYKEMVRSIFRGSNDITEARIEISGQPELKQFFILTSVPTKGGKCKIILKNRTDRWQIKFPAHLKPIMHAYPSRAVCPIK